MKEPGDYAADLAFHKAYEVLERTKKEAQNGSDSRRTVIIGSDTIVVCGEEVLGKPSDEADAARMLRMLSGRTHQVYTGVALICAEAGREESSRFWEKTDVIFYELSEEEVRAAKQKLLGQQIQDSMTNLGDADAISLDTGW